LESWRSWRIAFLRICYNPAVAAAVTIAPEGQSNDPTVRKVRTAQGTMLDNLKAV
jgi:hypothetical protein